MPRAAVTATRRRTDRGRRRAARASLTAAGILPTYDLLYGSQCGLLFEEQTHAAGYRETDGSWWPTEERALQPDGAVFREGTTGAIYRLADGTLVHAHLDGDSIRVRVAGPTRAACTAALAAFQGLYPASFVTTEGDSRVPVTFWSNSAWGPQPRLRRIEASPWEPIVGNYTAEVRDELAALMAWEEPGSDGQLILWQGSPGTGKTWALRALACEWSRWAEFHYITDPDSFFVDDPSYMVSVLLSDSYSVVDPADGSVFEEQAEGKWRVLILEDTGELLSAQAKEKYGQGLSRLLNVVDGMIGQGLRVLCLVTTNDELGELNEAVRRPGRCASQIVFGPLTAEEAQAWTGDPDAEAGTVAELYSRYGKADPLPADFEPEDEMVASLRAEFARPIRTHDDADELVPIPGTDARVRRADLDAALAMVRAAKDEDVRAEIARVAEEHRPDGGYGETYWNPDDRMVFWVSADWTSNEEVEAAEEAFLAIDGVDGLEHEAEGYPPEGAGWEQVYPAGETLEAVVALALEPLDVEPEPPVVAAAPPVMQLAVLPGDQTSDRLIDVLERFAEREHVPAPAPTFNLHFPQHLGVRVEPADVTVPVTVEPAPPTPLEVHSHSVVEVPAQEPPSVTVLAADPAPVQVDVHVPEPPAAPAPVASPTRGIESIRVEFDGQGNKVYVPVYAVESAT